LKLTEHEMLVTLATMAIKMDDLTPHDIIEAFRALGHGSVLDEARAGVTVPGVGVYGRANARRSSK
jgi:hypothetical protein